MSALHWEPLTAPVLAEAESEAALAAARSEAQAQLSSAKAEAQAAGESDPKQARTAETPDDIKNLAGDQTDRRGAFSKWPSP